MSSLPRLPEGHFYLVAGTGPLVFAMDWTAWLAPDETIESHEWSTDDPELTVADAIPDDTDHWTACLVSGGTAGNRAEVDCDIVTSAPQYPQRTLTFHVIDHWPT